MRSPKQDGSIRVRLDFQKNQLRILGFSPIGASLFDILYRDEIISIKGNLHGLQPQDILRDIQFTFWPIHFLQRSFPQLKITETLVPKKVRSVSYEGKVLLEIMYSDEALVPAHVTLQSLAYAYTIEMKNKRLVP